MAKTRRKKKSPQSQGEAPVSREDKTPKSFVFGRGKLELNLRLLEKDLRRVMMPNTAKKLRESTRNSVKDFLHVSGPLGVTHFLMLSSTREAPYLRIARTPRGPTLTFKILEYSLASDIAKAQTRPRAPPDMYEAPPLVKLTSCQRVLLINYRRESDSIDFRHYSISAQPVGVSRNIRKLVQNRKLPNLSALTDVSEFVTRSGYGSESENEDESARVKLTQNFGRINRASGQSAVKLHEVGPRLTLQLLKVEEGLCNGTVMYHQFVKKTPEEAAEQQARIEAKAKLKAERKAQQQENVRRKNREAKSGMEEEGEGEEDVGEGEREIEEDDDAEYYRQEVGEEPEEGFLSSSYRRGRGSFGRKGVQRGNSREGRDFDRGGEGSRGRGGRGGRGSTSPSFRGNGRERKEQFKPSVGGKRKREEGGGGRGRGRGGERKK